MSVRLAFVVSSVFAMWAQPTAAQDASDLAHGVREFTASGTWQAPAGVSRVTIELWAGGGGGAGGASAVGGGPGGGGGAGGSGAYLRASLGVKEGETYTIAIGAPGAAGQREDRAAAQPGGDGGDTTWSRNGAVLLVARGGRGGSAPKRGSYTGGAGGSGGEAQPRQSILVRAGNPGSRGQDGDFPDATTTSGGRGGAAVLGTLQPPGSFGGAGGAGMASVTPKTASQVAQDPPSSRGEDDTRAQWAAPARSPTDTDPAGPRHP